MWPFSSQSVLDDAVAQAVPQQNAQFGALASPQQQAPQKQNRILENPQIINALGRMGSAILIANSQGSGFGGAFGAGTQAFQDEFVRQSEEDRRNKLADAELAQREAIAERARQDNQYGVRSSGFEGDIARARVILNDPMSTDQQKATAQAVVETAERMQGSYDPVTGEFRYNSKNRFGDSAPAPATQSGSIQSPAQVLPEPTRQAPAGGLLPPPSLDGGSPDMSMFSAPATGNRKADTEVSTALRKASGEAEIAGRRTVNEGVGKVDSETFGQIANQTRTLSNMLPQLQRIETLAANTKTGGLGAARLEFGKLFGLDLDGVPEAQAITAIQNAIGPSLRTPGSGASSDKDVAIFMSSIPTLMNTPGGIREINKTYSQLLDRKKEEEKIARRLLREDGNLERLYEETETLGPVFKTAPTAPEPQAAPTFDRSAIEAEMRRRMLK